jgi:FAD/FMN-containing dehydrogenase
MLSLANLNLTSFPTTPSTDTLTSSLVRGNETSNDDDDEDVKIVTVQPGVTAEAFMNKVLYENGYNGIVPLAGGVGMGGFVLGGGYGLQSRMYGLAIDNVVGMSVILTTGEVKDVAEGDDLFWALRGSGGSNLGVVTSINYKVHRSHDIKLEATVKIALGELTPFLRKLGSMESNLRPEFALHVHNYHSPRNRSAPDLIDSVLSSVHKEGVPSSTVLHIDNEDDEREGFVTVSMFWMGDADTENQIGMKYIKNNIVPLFSNNATRDEVVYFYFSWSGTSRQKEQAQTWKEVYSAQSWNGFLLAQNNTEEVWNDIESSLSALFEYCKLVSPKINLWGGAISKVGSNETAFPHRNALYHVGIELLVPEGNDIDVANDEAHLVHAIWPSIARHLDGVYINNPMASLTNEEYPSAYWGNNLDRLKQLKQQYDPFHVFNFSQSIPILHRSIGT